MLHVVSRKCGWRVSCHGLSLLQAVGIVATILLCSILPFWVLLSVDGMVMVTSTAMVMMAVSMLMVNANDSKYDGYGDGNDIVDDIPLSDCC